MTTAVLIPVYDDWTAVARLLVELDRVLPPERRETRVLLVNDGSESDVREFAAAFAAARLDVDVLHLRRTSGTSARSRSGSPTSNATCRATPSS